MFGKDQSGSIATMFGLMLPALVVGVGGGIEISRGVEYRQRLISATDLACRQAAVYVESMNGLVLPSNYATTVQSYADKNSSERSLTSTATITSVPTVSALLLVTPIGLRPGNIHVTASGTLSLVFGAVLNKSSLSFSVVRDCAVSSSISSGPPTLLVSESFEAYKSQLKNGWGVFGTMSRPDCESAMCEGKSWSTTNTGVEVDQLSAITTGDGVQYGQDFAELDSDCNNRIGPTNANQTAACAAGGKTTNSSIAMTLSLPVGTYQVRYVYNARKNVDAYQYPNDTVICSNPKGTDGLTRNADVAKNASGDSTIALDGQTRRIELWVGPETSGYLSDNQSLTAATNPDYMKSYMSDVCVWSTLWVERTYTFKVTKAQDYRISWRAAGRDDSYGGLIDYLRICSNACP